IESKDSKVSVGNAAKQSHDVVGVGIDCIFNHAKVSTEADLGPQSDVIHLTSLDVTNESSQISSDADMVEQNKQDALDTLIKISQHKKPKKLNVARVVSEGNFLFLPYCILLLIEYIKTLSGKQVVVNIDSAWLNRNDMECLFHGDIPLSDELACIFDLLIVFFWCTALSAYIHCIRGEEHLPHREGGKVFLENTFISSLLKRDGDPKVLLNCVPSNEYRKFSLVPGSSKCKKSEVHVLDSMGQQITDRRDLYTTLKGLERQIKLAAEHKELYQDKWSNLDVASWPVIEKITTQMQTDGVSCGLWMINYMEYWTGSSLSDNDDITMFRFKLPAILWDSRLNTKKKHQNLDHNVDEDGESSSDVQIIDTPYCFNMAVRMIACNDALFLLEDKYHYMDLQLCCIPKSFLDIKDEGSQTTIVQLISYLKTLAAFHKLFRFHCIVLPFLLGSKVAMFQYSSVKIYNACKPQPTLEIHNPDMHEWLMKFSNHLLERHYLTRCLHVIHRLHEVCKEINPENRGAFWVARQRDKPILINTNFLGTGTRPSSTTAAGLDDWAKAERSVRAAQNLKRNSSSKSLERMLSKGNILIGHSLHRDLCGKVWFVFFSRRMHSKFHALSTLRLTTTAALGLRLSSSPPSADAALSSSSSSLAGAGSSRRQTGQLPCTPSHRSRQRPWKRCPHGISLPIFTKVEKIEWFAFQTLPIH
ncbi:hypothetical protein ACJX0J_014449, partial [Zea mays]